MTKPIYLDDQSTTRIDPRVAGAMWPYLEGKFGNPHSEHVFGWEAAEAVDEAARNVAGLSAPRLARSSSPPARPMRTTSRFRALRGATDVAAIMS